jgi:hypothetical protein
MSLSSDHWHRAIGRSRIRLHRAISRSAIYRIIDNRFIGHRSFGNRQSAIGSQ